MPFTEEQRIELAAPLNRSNVKTRKQGFSKVSYVEGWKCVEEANRIFGFDGWTRETVETRMVNQAERKIGQNKDGGWGVSYIARVKIVVFAGDSMVTREGVGAGHGIDRDLGQAHESAIKEAETDAMKRALMTFGYCFGLALYDKEQENVADDRTYEQNEKTIDQWGDRRGAELTRAAAPDILTSMREGRSLDAPQNGVIWDTNGERPATPEDVEPITATLKAAYLESARTKIKKATAADDLRTWWFSEESKKARADFELTAMELKDLSQFCKARIDALAGIK